MDMNTYSRFAGNFDIFVIVLMLTLKHFFLEIELIFLFTTIFLQYIDIGEDLNVPDDFTPTELATGGWWRHLVAGAVAGAVSRTSTAPLDRIKVYLQVQASKQRISDTFKYLLKEGGWSSLWRGNGINVLKIAPESAIKFMAYEQVKRYIRGQEQNRPMSIFERFVGKYFILIILFVCRQLSVAD
jgi:solute carrier family 25 (mitochondrial phosphate transporter), member 23/24/25/41